MGTFLPTLDQLAIEFDTTATMVSLGLDPLRRDDLILHRPGRGLIVNAFPKTLA